MQPFPSEGVRDFKHVIYNQLVEQYNAQNNPDIIPLLHPIRLDIDGETRYGFKFNEKKNLEKLLPELYALHIRGAPLDKENQNSVFIRDLYRFYLQACTGLLTKYFKKIDKFTYLYDDVPLFIPGGSLDEAEKRIKDMKSLSRKRKGEARTRTYLSHKLPKLKNA